MPNPKEREYVDTLICSDTHVGTVTSKSTAIVVMLAHFNCRQLILNGDIFDSEDLRRIAKSIHTEKNGGYHKGPRLKRSHHHVLAEISSLSKRSDVSVYLRGNHDEDLAEIIAFFTGTTVEREHRWEFKGKKFIAIHGDQFDEFSSKNKWITAIATDAYWWIQAILGYIGFGWFADRFCRFLKHAAKRSTNAFERVAKGALGYAQFNGYDHIVCGHTHMADYRELRGVHYYNDGCCTESPISCITIEDDGIYLRKFNDRGQVSKEQLPW